MILHTYLTVQLQKIPTLKDTMKSLGFLSSYLQQKYKSEEAFKNWVATQ